MSDTMNIEDYLAQGGVLTAPGNVPARYRGELMRLMASFVDSELAASAGFAGSINFAPGIKERIAADPYAAAKDAHALATLAKPRRSLGEAASRAPPPRSITTAMPHTGMTQSPSSAAITTTSRPTAATRPVT